MTPTDHLVQWRARSATATRATSFTATLGTALELPHSAPSLKRDFNTRANAEFLHENNSNMNAFDTTDLLGASAATPTASSSGTHHTTLGATTPAATIECCTTRLAAGVSPFQLVWWVSTRVWFRFQLQAARRQFWRASLHSRLRWPQAGAFPLSFYSAAFVF